MTPGSRRRMTEKRPQIGKFVSVDLVRVRQLESGNSKLDGKAFC